MLAYDKNLPRNKEFSVFYPEKIKYYLEKKSAQIFEKFTVTESSHRLQ